MPQHKPIRSPKKFPDLCQLEIKSMDSPEIDDIWNWVPIDPENVFFTLTLSIGCKDQRGGNDFQLLVATKKQIHVQIPGEDKTITQWFEIYSFDALKKRLDTIIEDCSCDNWDHCVQLLRKRFVWEYENYK